MIREGGYRPYIRKSGGRRYITLKRGSRELSVGPYTEELWQALDSEWTIAAYGEPAHAGEAEPRLAGKDAQKVFKLLSEGHDPAQVVEETGLDPDLVMLATEKYMQLKQLPVGNLAQRLEKCKRNIDGLTRLLLESAGVKRRLCLFYRNGVCQLGWSRELLSLAEAESRGLKLFTVVGSSEDKKHLFIAPLEMWCLICPYHAARTEQEARR